MRLFWRRAVDRAMTAMMLMCVIAGVAALVSILLYVGVRGIRAIDWGFFTQLPKPVGEPGGGMANAMVGTLILVGLACLGGLPIGILAGVYLAEYGHGRLAAAVRFAADVLQGVPSIVIGIVAYALVVLPMRRFSSIAGGVALAIMMIPLVTRTTEEMLRLVPGSLREAALALGVPPGRVVIRVVMRTALPGIVTGVMLGVARVAGETAPLLFTALGNRFWHTGLDQPIASLPVQIYTYAISPYADWHDQAWAAALVLVAIVLITNVIARLATRARFAGR